MSLQSLMNSPLGVGVALALGRALPQPWGYAVTRKISRRLAGRKQSEMVRAIRSNQWVVHGGQSTAAELDKLAQGTLLFSSRALFDFYHNLENRRRSVELVEYTPRFNEAFKICLSGKQGTLFVMPHVSAFDLAGYTLTLRGLKFQILSVPQPNAGYQWQNDLRRKQGIDITPFSAEALQKARRNLQNGGTVLTGMDRPWPGSEYHPHFFGRPASLPVAYIRLAIKVEVPIYVVTCLGKPNGGYWLDCEGPFTMQRDADPVLNWKVMLKYY